MTPDFKVYSTESTVQIDTQDPSFGHQFCVDANCQVKLPYHQGILAVDVRTLIIEIIVLHGY